MGKEFNFLKKDAILAEINKAEPKPKTTFTATEIVKLSRSAITTAIKKKRFSFADIVKYFNNHGCDITAEELEHAYTSLSTKKQLKDKTVQNPKQKNK